MFENKNETHLKNHKKANKSEVGFTIMELLVTMSIVAIISSLALVNVGHGKRENQIKNAVRVFVSDLRRAQNMAIAGKVIPGCNTGSTERGRAGIYVDKSIAGKDKYVLFFDKNNDKICSTVSPCDLKCGSGGGEAVEVVG